ncbi:MAG: hypothetical protein FJ086_15860 [Deltaproteobacteria bacterium]|nr:hypothetical protein [Deltaproteobacteria bacterium]
MHTRPAPLLIAALALSLCACDISRAASQVQARQVVVGTVLHTPAIEVDLLAASGVDAGAWLEDAGVLLDGGYSFGDGGIPWDVDGGFGLLDAGLPWLEDAGITLTGDGKITLPPQTLAAVLFASRTGASLTSADVEPVVDAAVLLSPAGGAPVTSLAGDGNGTYALTSQDEPGFSYVEQAEYRVTAEWKGERYTAVLDESPEVERISEFHPDGGTVLLAAGAPLTFHRREPPAGEQRNFGLVTVFPVDTKGNRGIPTYSNAPTRPTDVLSLIATPAKWRASPITIPGEAFPEPNATYVVLFQSMKLGGAESSNLFAGSALLVGTADVAIVSTRSP